MVLAASRTLHGGGHPAEQLLGVLVHRQYAGVVLRGAGGGQIALEARQLRNHLGGKCGVCVGGRDGVSSAHTHK